MKLGSNIKMDLVEEEKSDKPKLQLQLRSFM